MNNRPIISALREALAMIAFPALVCVSGLLLDATAMEDRRAAGEAAAVLHGRQQQAQQAAWALAAYGERYAELRQRGVIGEPQRLAIVEALQAVARELRLRNVTWTLSPSTGGAISISTMNVQVGAVDEVELLKFFDRLRARAPAVLWVRQCTIERPEGGQRPARRDTDNLTAECRLEWRTVRVHG